MILMVTVFLLFNYSGKRWHKADVEEPLSGAENRRREKIGAGDAVWATALS